MNVVVRKYVIQAEWGLPRGNGHIMGKFLRIGTCLKKWSREALGNIPTKINQLLREELQSLTFDDVRPNIQDQRKSVLKDLAKYTSYEEELWAQRSRVTRMKEGYSNTKFFHNYAKFRGWRNKVTGVFNLQGQWQEEISGIQQAFVDYFEQLFTTEGSINANLIVEAVIPKVTSLMNGKLLAPFTRLDIEETLKQMAPNKPPGHDGLSVLFFQ